MIFIIPGWTGHFLLGAYLQKVRVGHLVLYVLLVFGFTCTAVGTYVMTATRGKATHLFLL
jgi:hypothetical protein